jgi:glycerol-1-phosphate dehydrogenase [NAD(P)+]
MGNTLIQNAIQHAQDTRSVVIESGAHAHLPMLLHEHFPAQNVFLIADENTFKAAGEDVCRTMVDSGISLIGEHIFPGTPRLKPDIKNVNIVEKMLKKQEAIPIAVGSGTINDIVKLAAHRCERAYIAVGTAASMDGYTSFAAAITHEGVKKVDPCPAPRIFIADLDVFTEAPTELTSSGYADLIAKINSGADWIIADFVESEPIQKEAWSLIQPALRHWLEKPERIPQGDPAEVENLMVGLVMAGLAMQAARSSWPASGSEHLFSHLWEMRGLERDYVSHGHKVGVGTVASSALVDELLAEDLDTLDIDGRIEAWPDFSLIEERVRANFEDDELVRTCITESQAKYATGEKLKIRVEKVRNQWHDLRDRLRTQMMLPGEVHDRLVAAGCPTAPGEIGLSLETFQADYARIRFLRARYTCFDLAEELGVLDRVISTLFSEGGYWASK